MLARKPLDGTLTANVLKHGTGALNIDGCRIHGADGTGHWSGDDGSDATSRPGYDGGFTTGGKKANGRWPANIAHDGSHEAVAVFPSEAGAAAPVTRRGSDKFRNTYGTFAGNTDEDATRFHGDSGSAGRFFYCAKASRAERDRGLHGAIKPTRDSDRATDDGAGGDNPRNRTNQAHLNSHPTVKPVALMSWLIRLVTPPGGLVLDPFCGSGSTGVAAASLGVRFVGVDITAEYCAIANLRVRHAISERLDVPGVTTLVQQELFA